MQNRPWGLHPQTPVKSTDAANQNLHLPHPLILQLPTKGGCNFLYFTFAINNDRGIVLHFVAEPYLDIGNGKQWRPAVAKVIASIVESEQKAKGMMAQGFKMSDSQWEYAYRCFELMNLDILAHLFSADGVLKRGS